MSRSTKILKGCSTLAANFYVSKAIAETLDMTNKEFSPFVDSSEFDCLVSSWMLGSDTPETTLKAARRAIIGEYALVAPGRIGEVRAALVASRALRSSGVEIIAQGGDIHLGKKGLLEVKSGYMGLGKPQANLNVRRVQLNQGIKNFLFIVTEDLGVKANFMYFLVPAREVAHLMEGSRSFESGSVNLAYRPYGNGVVDTFLNQYRLENSAELMKAFRKLR